MATSPVKEKANEYKDTIKLGRTHLQDAVPMMVSDELGAWAEMCIRDSFYTFLLRFKGVKIYPYTRISLSSKFGGMNKINRNVTLIDSSVGLGTYINNFSFFLKTKTGGFCSIGPDVRVIVGNHPINNVCIYPCLLYTSRCV